MTIDSKVSVRDTVFLQEVDDEIVLLDINTEEYYSLDEIGGIFYKFLKEEEDLPVIVRELAEHFNVKSQEIEKDLFTFIKSLKEKGLVE